MEFPLMRPFPTLCLALAAALPLAACGQKGPLVRPDSSPQAPVVIRPAPEVPMPTVTPLPPATPPTTPQA